MVTPAARRGADEMHVTVLCPVDLDVLSRLTLSEGFRVFFGGDVRLIRAMLNGVVSAPGGRCAVALVEGEVVGFMCVLPPLPGDRFHGLPEVVEAAAAEVVPAFRRRGIFRAMFEAALARTLDDEIVFAVGDPGFADEGESPRAYRHRFTALYRAFGFFPLPTDYLEAHLRRDSVFMVRVGDGVPREGVDAFLDRLHETSLGRGRPRVAISLRNGVLRNLVRADLERSGFAVVSVTAEPGPQPDADILVSEFAGQTGPLTVRVVDGDAMSSDGPIVWVPVTELTRLPEVIRERSAWWQRSSRSA